MEAVAYEPPSLGAQERRLLDALAGRRAEFEVEIGGSGWRIEPLAPAAGPVAAPVLAVRAGESVWRVSLAATQEVYDALGIPDDVDREALPDAVLWGVAEARLDGVLGILEALTGQPAKVVSPDEAHDGPVCCLEFRMTAPGGRGVRGWVHVPLDEETVHVLERTLAARPRVRNEVGRMPVELGVEAGRMSLPLSELRGAEPGDVLLPEEWHPASGCVYLCAPPVRVRVSWPDSGCEAWSIVNESESNMSEVRKEAAPEAEQAGESSQPSAPAGGLGGIEVDVVFEIGRLRLSVDELENLGDGRTLPLPGALGPQVPVTILGNGRKLGTGRIVNVGETLGVQIVGLEGREA